jgi:hypothetical protein
MQSLALWGLSACHCVIFSRWPLQRGNSIKTIVGFQEKIIFLYVFGLPSMGFRGRIGPLDRGETMRALDRTAVRPRGAPDVASHAADIKPMTAAPGSGFDGVFLAPART